MANIISLTRITKEDWYKHRSTLYKNNLFLIELDASYQKGILHFSHEISILVYLDNNKLKLIEGYEIGPEDSTYHSEDWNYLKERYCISDELIIEKINDFINQTTNN